MKKFLIAMFCAIFCLSLSGLVACDAGAGLTLVLEEKEQVVSSGEYKLDFPSLMDENGNVIMSYKISVLSVVKEDGTEFEANGRMVDFTAQGRYTVTYGIEDLPRVKNVEKVFVVIDETPPQVVSFDYPEAVVVGRTYLMPTVELSDSVGVNEEKTDVSIIDKYNKEIENNGRNFSVPSGGDYRFRIKTEDLNGVSKTYYYPFVAYEVCQQVTRKVGYFDEEAGQKQLVTGLKKGEKVENYSLSYTTNRAFDNEKGSTVITVNEWTADVCVRLVSPYIKDVSEYSRLVYRIYVETTDKPYSSVLAGVYTSYRDLSVNKWEEMAVSTKALKEGGSFIDGTTEECITAADITNLTIRLFRWSNPVYGGVEDKEGFPAGTKIYISAMEAVERDPSIIYEFNSDEGDHGAKAVNKATGKPVNSYGGSVENGSFAGLGEGADSVRFYLQNDAKTEDEYLVYLPLLDVKRYGSVTVTIKTNVCKKMGVAANECIEFADPSKLTIVFTYNEATDDMSVTFASGSEKITTTVTDSDVINGYSQFAIYAVGVAYTEIYIAPIRIS